VAINEAGVAVGRAAPGAVAWDPDGTERDLGVGPGSDANDIAEDGTIVGRRTGADGVTEAYVRHPDGTVESLPRLPDTLIDVASGLNDAGDVVGYTVSASDGQTKPVLWAAPDHQPVVLAGSGAAADVADDGTVIGNRSDPRGAYVQALLWRPGTHEEVELPQPLGTSRTRVTGVNDAGQMAGTLTATYGGPDRAVRWDPGPDGSYELVELGGLGGGSSAAEAINDVGDVVGHAVVPGPEGARHVALYPADG
jgi:uncharacterized membrane protein